MTNTDYTLPPVTIERVIDVMKAEGAELDTVEGSPSAITTLEGLPVAFTVLDSAVIVRCDVSTDASYSQANASMFLAAHQINAVRMGARAVIADYEDTLIVRTERDVHCHAGMNDAQLKAAITAAVSGVIGAQKAMIATAEQMANMAGDAPAES